MTIRTMAHDEQRSFAARSSSLQDVVHAEHDARRVYGRGQSVGFQYFNQPVHMAGPSRRPLPTPRTRPESMPPPLRQSPLVVQSPAPSRPAILAPSATFTTSPTAPPARRPLPTPVLPQARLSAKHSSVDLTARPRTSPIIHPNPTRDLPIPSSFSRRTTPVPDGIQRSSFPASVQIRANVTERRNTIPDVLPPHPDPRAESPERVQPAQPAQTSPTRRPLPSSPTEPPRIPSLHQRVPPPSEDDHRIREQVQPARPRPSRSATLPQPPTLSSSPPQSRSQVITSPTSAVPESTSPVRQQQAGRPSVPPQLQQIPHPRERQPEKQKYNARNTDIDLDDPPPPSLRRSRSPLVSSPDNHHDKGDADDDAFGPSIVVSGPGNGPSISVSAPDPPVVSVSMPSIAVSEHGTSGVDSPSTAFSPPVISVSDPSHSQKSRPSPGGYGSRHTQIQQLPPLNASPGRGGSKRGLPPPPSSSTMRTNGLSCAGCGGPIVGRIVSAMGQRWHPNCFKCTVCNELLEHVSSYEHDGKPYCHLDYHETFAPRCFHCKTAIIDERFITLDDSALGKRTYHEQHFFCAECGDPFLAPSGPLPPSVTRTGELNVTGDGEFVDDDVGFTVYRGHPYCESCHVRLRMPKCKACKKSIRDGVRAVEALGGKWCWGCFVCECCKRPFEDPSFFLRDEKPFCEPCFSLMLRNEV